ncbi:diguanylate cyclase [Aliivibrio salmonicida]|uniref:GGDEF domain-containing protein n=1 Tax=Aliivibrio salmonicida TaxID=40269 RepID=UPI003D0A58F8
MTLLTLWLMVSFSSYAISIMASDSWKKDYHQARIQDPNLALIMLEDVYNGLEPSAERVYVAVRMHGFITRRGGEYPLPSPTANPYSQVEYAIVKAMNLEDQAQVSNAFFLTSQSYQQADKLDDPDLDAIFNIQLCKYNLMLGQLYLGEFYCQSAIQNIKTSTNHYIDLKWPYRLLALAYQEMNNFTKALKASEEVIKLSQPYDINDTTFNNIGNLLISMGKLNSGELYLLKSLEIRKSRNIAQKVAQTETDLAELYLKKGQLDKAKLFSLRAIEHFNSGLFKIGLGSAYLVHGKILTAEGFFDEGIEYLYLALSTLKDKKNAKLIINTYQSLSRIYLEYQHPNKALELINLAINKAKKTESKNLLASSYLHQAKILKGMGKFEAALESHLSYEALQQWINHNKEQQAYEALELRRNTLESQIIIQNSENNKKQQQTELLKTKQNRNLLFLCFIFLFLFTLYMTYSRRKFRLLTEKDTLTTLNNRASIFNKIKSTLKTPHSEMALIMLDVDNFKQFNDEHGHPNGDLALKHLSIVLQKHLSFPHEIGRVGGEEFMIILKNLSKLECSRLINKLRVELEQSTFMTLDVKRLAITASFSWMYIEESMTDIDQIYFVLDEGLYQAKANGRNCIVDALIDPIT